MSFHICCPQCGAFCNVSDADVGKTALCGNCDQPIIISRAPSRTRPTPPLHQQDSVSVGPPSSNQPLRRADARALIQPDSSRPTRRWGCVVAVVIVGAVLLLPQIIPTLPAGREEARRSVCNNNVKQIALALHNYHDTYGSFPPPYLADENGRPMHSWRVLILPFMEHQALYDQYNFDEPWDGPNNRKLWSQMPDSYRCPSATSGEDFLTTYQVVVGENSLFESGRTNSLSDVYDGTSNTILVVEAASAPVHWMEPTDVQYQPGTALPAALWSSNHEGRGLHLSYADGSISFLDKRVSAAELRSLIERADGVYHVR